MEGPRPRRRTGPCRDSLSEYGMSAVIISHAFLADYLVARIDRGQSFPRLFPWAFTVRSLTELVAIHRSQPAAYAVYHGFLLDCRDIRRVGDDLSFSD